MNVIVMGGGKRGGGEGKRGGNKYLASEGEVRQQTLLQVTYEEVLTSWVSVDPVAWEESEAVGDHLYTLEHTNG